MKKILLGLKIFITVAFILPLVFAGGKNRCCDHEDRRCCCRGYNNEQILLRDRHDGYFNQYNQNYNLGFNNYNGFNVPNLGFKCRHNDGCGPRGWRC